MKITQILEAREIFQKALDGNLGARAIVAESMTTSDFPLLLGAAYGRELMAAYETAPSVWQGWSSRVVVPNFKKQKLQDILGGRSVLDKVPEGDEYPARSLAESEYEFRVEKFGNRIPLTWEMIINDELGAFRNLPERLAIAARVTEDTVASKALFSEDLTTLDTNFFKSANGNAPAATALTRENLATALTTIQNRKDEDGNIVVFPGGILMVHPSLEFTARTILGATTTTTVTGGVTTVEENPLAGKLTLVVNPYLNLTSHAKKSGLWFVLPDPKTPRPATVTAFLGGNESPDLRVKSDAGSRPGGGEVDPLEGSFDNDSIQYRVRHSAGSALIDPLFTFVSYGS